MNVVEDKKSIVYKIRNLSISYSGAEEAAVKAFNCVIHENESLGLVGESGSGKTSIAMCMMGLLDNATCEGELFLEGVRMHRQGEHSWDAYRWRDIAIVFQNALNVLNPALKVIYQVEEPLIRHLQLSKIEARQRAQQLLSEVGLDAVWWEAKPHQLSGGMRQKVLIAMALACRPKLLILDEPTMSLDTESKQQVISLIQELRRLNGFSLLVISHELKLIEALCDRIHVIYNGYHLEHGSVYETLQRPKHPYTKGLIAASWELDSHKDIWGIPRALREAVQGGCPFFSRCFQARECCKAYEPHLGPIVEGSSDDKTPHVVACVREGIATLLKADNLNKVYSLGAAKVYAVKKVSLNIQEGEVLALVGQSGSGKSTLAAMLSGLETTEGHVSFDGGGVPSAKLKGGVQLVTQDPSAAMNLNWRIIDVVIEPLRHNSKLSIEESRRLAGYYLSKVHLPDEEGFLNKRAGEVSGGQRQRIAIARALSMEPKLLIADEISAMLDPSSSANLIRLLKGMQNHKGFAMLYITHDLYLARKIADRVIVMSGGNIIKEGSPVEVLGNE